MLLAFIHNYVVSVYEVLDYHHLYNKIVTVLHPGKKCLCLKKSPY